MQRQGKDQTRWTSFFLGNYEDEQIGNCIQTRNMIGYETFTNMCARLLQVGMSIIVILCLNDCTKIS